MNRIRIENRKTLKATADTIIESVRLDTDSLVVFNDDGAAVKILAAQDGGLALIPDRVTKHGASMAMGAGFPVIVPAGSPPDKVRHGIHLAVKRAARGTRKIVQ